MVDGMHWIDPSTMELLEMIMNHGPTPGLFLLMTSRPELPANWSHRSYIMEFDLHNLSRRASREIVIKTAADKELPEALIKRIIDETDGIPMFIEELTLALIESEEWQGDQDLSSNELAKIHIPATLQESLSARVDQLGSAKSLLQVCSMLGRNFSYRLLLTVSESGNEMALMDELGRIVNAEFLFKRGTDTESNYAFKHSLIQETAYQSLLKSTRKKLHLRIAEILESDFPDNVKQRPQQLAYHFAMAGETEKAIGYWTAASRRSVSRSSRNAMEVPLQSVLGSALLAVQGYTAKEVGEVFTRARTLSEQTDNSEQMFQVVVGLWMYYVIQGQYAQAQDIASQLLAIAEAGEDAGQLVQAHYTIGYTSFYRGEFKAARDAFEEALLSEVEGSNYSSQSASSDDTRTHVRCVLGLVCWHLGLPETALKYAKDADDLAHKLDQPYAITCVAFMNAWLYQRRREPGLSAVCAKECVTLAEQNGYRFFIPLGRFVQAWTESRPHETGSTAEDKSGAAKMKEIIELCINAGQGLGMTYMIFQLAEEYLELGMYSEALEQLQRGLEHAEKVGELFLEPEYYRLRGRLCLASFDSSNARSDLDEAIEFLTNALSRAKLKQTKALQLRAATDLAVALSHKGENKSAAETLEAVIDSFGEFDKSGDCARAREVLKKIR
jgi:tetratricopeptide (TPR) repeat protein